MTVSWYEAKQYLLAPRTAYKRNKLGPELDPYGIALFELYRYSRSIFSFARATAANPDILTDADLDPSSVVIDAGAYIGEWSERVAERYDPTIHAFEPDPRSYAVLEQTFADQPRVHPHPFALGRSDHRACLDGAGPGSTVSAEGDPDATDEVTVRDVAAVLDALEVDRIDLLKLNIEGGEYDVIDRLDETGWLARIDTVSVQFHEWHPHAHRRRLRNRRALRRTHTEAWTYPLVWELWRRTT